MKIIIILLGLFVLGVLSVQAQSLRVGYYGETVTHYGLKVAAEWSLKAILKSAIRRVKNFWSVQPWLRIATRRTILDWYSFPN